MSRSYKKHTFASDYSRKTTAWQKRRANKQFRRSLEDFPKGNHYQKIFDSWNIHDWHVYESEHYARKYWKECQAIPDHGIIHYKHIPEEQYIKIWKKCFRRK